MGCHLIVAGDNPEVLKFRDADQTDPKQADESVPLDRYGKPEEVADAVAFLASSAARFISGQTLIVDGARYTRLYQ